MGENITMTNKLKVSLSSCGNINYGQNPDTPLLGVPDESKEVYSLEEASKVCRQYIEEHYLGGSQWNGGEVYDEAGVLVAHVSYNGRVWSPDRQTEILVQEQVKHEPKEAPETKYEKMIVDALRTVGHNELDIDELLLKGHKGWENMHLYELCGEYKKYFGSEKLRSFTITDWLSEYTGGNVYVAKRDFPTLDGQMVMVSLNDESALVTKLEHGFVTTSEYYSDTDTYYELSVPFEEVIAWKDFDVEDIHFEDIIYTLFSEEVIEEIKTTMKDFDKKVLGR